MRNTTTNWLKENGIVYDELIFTKKDKLDYCLEKGIDIMIEDYSENINKIATKVPVICFDATYNRDINNDNVTRCYSWYDIYNKIGKDIN